MEGGKEGKEGEGVLGKFGKGREVRERDGAEVGISLLAGLCVVGGGWVGWERMGDGRESGCVKVQYLSTKMGTYVGRYEGKRGEVRGG